MPPLLDLDDPLCRDRATAGGKAAGLAAAAAAGLPVLAGFVVPAEHSRPHMRLGVDALARRGSGGARLEITQTPLDAALAAEITERARALSSSLVVRSSSVLEAAATWSGAFTSYLELGPEEVPRAVPGCWASAFTPATLDRYAATGVEPGTADMAVVVQPFLAPEFGGVARLEDGAVVVVAVAGSPAPLVQGWEPGEEARVGDDGTVSGAAADLMGRERLEAVVELLHAAHRSLGATGCEWATRGDAVVLLQVTHTEPPPPRPALALPRFDHRSAPAVARLVRRYPGPLGEQLVLPWAVASPGEWMTPASPIPAEPLEALDRAMSMARTLTAEVWGRPFGDAVGEVRALRGGDGGWDRLDDLTRPDTEAGETVLGLLATVRAALVEAGAVTWPELGWHLETAEVRRVLAGGPTEKLQRIGHDRWEPFTAAVAMTVGNRGEGSPAAPGIGFGRLCWIESPAQRHKFRPRDVVVAPNPTPDLAPLLWDAAGVVTLAGGPAAHLFESARALAIPAVAGFRPDDATGWSPGAEDVRGIAVDGSSGAVYVTDW